MASPVAATCGPIGRFSTQDLPRLETTLPDVSERASACSYPCEKRLPSRRLMFTAVRGDTDGADQSVTPTAPHGSPSSRTGLPPLLPRTDALVIDAGLRQALVATQSLGRSGLRVGTAECHELCDRRFRVPAFASRWSTWSSDLPTYYGDPDVFAKSVLAIAADRRSRVVIPSSDGSIAALRPWRRCFEEQDVVLAIASEPAVEVANDKLRTLAAASELGLSGPRTLVISGLDGGRAALAEIGYPAIIKPIQSWARSGHKSARLTTGAVHNEAEAVPFLEEIYKHGGGAVIQQWVGGARESVNIMYAGGRIVAEVAQLTYRTAPVLGGVNVVRETIPMPDDLRAGAIGLVESLGLEGYSEVEFRRDSEGRPLIMEINARLTAGVELAVRSGVDFPSLHWRWAAGEPLQPVRGYRSGVRMRFLAGDLEWLWENLKHPGRVDSVPRARAVGVFMREFLHRQAYDYIDPTDLRATWVAFVRDAGDVRRRFVTKVSGSNEMGPSERGQNRSM